MSGIIFNAILCKKCAFINHPLKLLAVNSNLKVYIHECKNTSITVKTKYSRSSYHNTNRLQLKLKSRILTNRYCTHSYDLENLVNNPKVRKYIDDLTLEYKKKAQNDSKYVLDEIPHLVNTHSWLGSKIRLEENLTSLEELTTSGNKNSEKDNELTELVEEEKNEYLYKIRCVDLEILKSLIPKSPLDDCHGVVMEISAGVGGQEAMLFANDLYTMYSGYINYRGWTVELAEYDSTDLGGIRHVSLLVNGKYAYKYLNGEAGVHRVQRIPTTEKSGRIHTSTVTVAVYPQPEEVDIVLNDKDLKIDTKRASGAGGQHVNTTDSAIRILHIPSGIAVECQTERSQLKNKQIAMQKLRAKLYEIQINEQMSEIKCTKKMQVGTSGRSEKIRTYNFNQDRITDHRLSSNAHNLTVFLQGGEPFHRLVEQLLETKQKQLINDFVQNITHL